MSDSLRNSSPNGLPKGQDYETTVSPKSLGSVELAELRRALHEKGWTLEALAAHMAKTPGRDFSTIRKVLHGERPMPEGFIDDLPSIAVGLWHARRAQSNGWLIAEPSEPDVAFQQVVAGMLSLVMHGAVGALLPKKALAMAKVEAQSHQQKKGIA